MLTYFLQVNLCWLLFYGLYYALLSKETFFKLNRFYLIISLLAGLFMPIISSYQAQWVNIPVVMPITEIAQPIHQNILVFQDNIDNNWATSTPQTWNLGLILRGGYLLGVIFFFTRFLIGLFKIYQLFRTASTFQNTHFTLVQVEGLSTPFSFFHWIFIDKNRYTPLVLEPIIEHEKAHVLQKHSWDIFFIEILRGVFWGSPLIYLFANSIRHVHEYLADEAVLRQTEKKTYGLLLVNQAQTPHQLLFVNHFNLSQLKKRFIMMSRNPSQNKALAKYILATPIFLFLFSAFIKPNNGLFKNTEIVDSQINTLINQANTHLNKTPTPQDSIRKKENTSIISLSGHSYHYFKPHEIKAQTQLTAAEGYEVISFTFERRHKSSLLKEASESITNYGAKFNNQVLSLIAKAELGDSYYFKNIKVLDKKINDTYIFGEMLFSVSLKPNFLASQLTHIIDFKNQAITQRVLDINEIKNIKGLVKEEGYNFDFEPNMEIEVSRGELGNFTRKTISNKGYTLTPEAINFLKTARIDDYISFSVKYKGEGISGITHNSFKIVDYTLNQTPHLVLPKGKLTGNITKNDIQKAEYLVAKAIKNGQPKTLKIVKFSVLLMPSGYPKEDVKEVVNMGANLSTEVKKLLNSAKEGDEIVFNNAQALDNDTNQVEGISGLIFTIKSK